MAQPVWVLSVDLQAKTATFASGMGDAAKGARSSFQDIKAGANDMARDTNYSMMEARHGVMLLGEEFGFHLPRALTSFIASLGPVGAAMEAAFPFLAIIVGATLLLEHLHKLSEESDKLTASQAAFGNTVSRVLGDLDDKLLQAGIRTDELNHNHLAALEKQLELIDHQSLKDLVHSFDELAKAADTTFLNLKTHWFSLSAGSAGAVHALKEFKSQYDELLAKGKEGEAGDLLKGTLDQAKAFLNTMEAAKGTLAGDDKELKAQQDLVEILQAQVHVQESLNKLKKEEKGDLIQQYDNSEVINLIGRADKIAAMHKKMAAEDEKDKEARMRLDDEFARHSVEKWAETLKLQEEAGMAEAHHVYKMGELKIAADRDSGNLALSTLRSVGRARLDLETQLANEEYQNKMTQNAKEIEALNKEGKDYTNKLLALQNKQLEIEQAFEDKKTQLKEKAEEERNRRLISAQQKMEDAEVKSLTNVLGRHETFTKSMLNLGEQVGEGMVQTALKSILAQDMTKISDAKYAARKGWIAGTHFPFPADLVMAPLLAAAGFTAVMAFERGGIVPGMGSGDTVPAMLTPGETVLPKSMTDALMRSGANGGSVTHVHGHFAPEIHAVDAEGVDRMLRTHADTFHRHFASHVRRMNH